jgi:enoyl-CoA hydratase/carnithine racemase
MAHRDEVRVIVIRGAGEKFFSSGYDISALPTDLPADLQSSLKETPPLERALSAIRNFPYPVIAMVNGHAYGGGCELAIGCDIRIAARKTKMGMPPAKLGLVYPYQGFRRFLTVIGFARTLEIFLTGRTYDSQGCFAMGLVNHVVEDDHLEHFTYELAWELAENAPLSLRGTKRALYRMAENPVLGREEEEALQSLFVQSLKSQDHQEAKQAFMEKRRPCFQGK